jgi:hypothetical protein
VTYSPDAAGPARCFNDLGHHMVSLSTFFTMSKNKEDKCHVQVRTCGHVNIRGPRMSKPRSTTPSGQGFRPTRTPLFYSAHGEITAREARETRLDRITDTPGLGRR